jgi:hypothetical protein
MDAHTVASHQHALRPALAIRTVGLGRPIPLLNRPFFSTAELAVRTPRVVDSSTTSFARSFGLLGERDELLVVCTTATQPGREQMHRMVCVFCMPHCPSRRGTGTQPERDRRRRRICYWMSHRRQGIARDRGMGNRRRLPGAFALFRISVRAEEPVWR